jgi:hypothetical protein
MNFLTLYPTEISAVLNDEGSFVGEMSMNIEQYGLFFSEVKCAITMRIEAGHAQPWYLAIDPIDSVEVPHFTKFVDAMNSYVFNVLCFEPHLKRQGSDSPRIQLFFDEIFFDMSEEKPRARSANPTLDGKTKPKAKAKPAKR